jgi:predicted DsbA family dithiol-disulfide isomerase
MRAELIHQIATDAAKQLVDRATDAGLDYPAIALACETVVAVVVASAAEQSGTPDRARFAQEIIEAITERAHQRVQAYLRKEGGHVG